MRRHITGFSLILAALALLSPAARASGGCPPAPVGTNLPPCCATTNMQAGGRCLAPATQYQFSLVSFGFEKSDGTEVRFGSPQLFDAAAVNAGAAIGDYLSGVELPPATYVAVRPALSEQVSIRVNSLTADGRRCSGSLAAPSRQPSGSAWPDCGVGQPDAATPMCRSGGLLKIRDDRLGSFTIGGSSAMTLTFQFDVNNGAVCVFAPGNGGNSGLELGVLSVGLKKS